MKDAMITCTHAVPAAPGLRSPVLRGFTDADLRVGDIMTDNVVCVVPDETVLAAVRRMSECRVSCVMVVEGGAAVGILTERDVLRGVAAGGRDPTTLKVAERMSRPVIALTPDTPVLEASAIMGSKNIKRLAVVDGEQLLGLVTQSDITRGLVSLWPYKEVGDVMRTKVVTVNTSATVAEAAALMSSRNISCVVVMRQHDPVGIMTEKDVLKRVVALRRDPGATLVANVMSHPIVTLPPAHSILCVSRMMDRMRIHRVVVSEGKQVYGIVSQTDILDAVRRELQQIREAQLHREAEVSRLTESTAQNLSLIESLVRDMSGSAELPDPPSPRPGIGGHASCGSPSSESHGPQPASGVSPMVISLQDLISESKSNLYRVSRIMEKRRDFTGEFDGPDGPTLIPLPHPDATRSAQSRPVQGRAATDQGPVHPSVTLPRFTFLP